MSKKKARKPTEEFFQVGKHDSQGKRSNMEDTTLISTPFINELGLLVAVFDGHNGSRCSQFLRDEMELEIQKCTKFVEGTCCEKKEALGQILQDVDKKWLTKADKENLEDGSTGICVIMLDEDLFVANVGDSRAIMCKGSDVVPLSNDHKPEAEKEKDRILEAGGLLIGGRLLGKLDVSRSFGDQAFKKQKCGLTSEPEIIHKTLTPDVDFIVVGCDGFYDQWNNNDILTKLQELEMKKKTVDEMAKYFVEEAIDRGSEDNVTVVVVKFEKKFKRKFEQKKKRESPSLFGWNWFNKKETTTKESKERNRRELLALSESESIPDRTKPSTYMSRTPPAGNTCSPYDTNPTSTINTTSTTGKLKKSNSSGPILQPTRISGTLDNSKYSYPPLEQEKHPQTIQEQQKLNLNMQQEEQPQTKQEQQKQNLNMLQEQPQTKQEQKQNLNMQQKQQDSPSKNKKTRDERINAPKQQKQQQAKRARTNLGGDNSAGFPISRNRENLEFVSTNSPNSNLRRSRSFTSTPELTPDTCNRHYTEISKNSQNSKRMDPPPQLPPFNRKKVKQNTNTSWREENSNWIIPPKQHAEKRVSTKLQESPNKSPLTMAVLPSLQNSISLSAQQQDAQKKFPNIREPSRRKPSRSFMPIQSDPQQTTTTGTTTNESTLSNGLGKSKEILDFSTKKTKNLDFSTKQNTTSTTQPEKKNERLRRSRSLNQLQTNPNTYSNHKHNYKEKVSELSYLSMSQDLTRDEILHSPRGAKHKNKFKS